MHSGEGIKLRYKQNTNKKQELYQTIYNKTSMAKDEKMYELNEELNNVKRDILGGNKKKRVMP